MHLLHLSGKTYSLLTCSSRYVAFGMRLSATENYNSMII